MTRRFPAPWHADKMPGGYVVRDANGQALVYVYSRENEAEALQAKVLRFQSFFMSTTSHLFSAAASRALSSTTVS